MSKLEAQYDDEFFVNVIVKWKSYWMNQKQNSEADYQNYLHRALGVDANMKYHLARLMQESVAPALSRIAELEAEISMYTKVQELCRYTDSDLERRQKISALEIARTNLKLCRENLQLQSQLKVAEAKLAETERQRMALMKRFQRQLMPMEIDEMREKLNAITAETLSSIGEKK